MRSAKSVENDGYLLSGDAVGALSRLGVFRATGGHIEAIILNWANVRTRAINRNSVFTVVSSKAVRFVPGVKRRVGQVWQAVPQDGVRQAQSLCKDFEKVLTGSANRDDRQFEDGDSVHGTWVADAADRSHGCRTGRRCRRRLELYGESSKAPNAQVRPPR
jgi:hypothetical protein